MGAAYAVFDDLVGGLSSWGTYKAWLGGQREFTATDKYRHKVCISWGKPCILLANSDPRQDSGVDVAWLEANVTFVEIYKEMPIAWFDCDESDDEPNARANSQ